MRSSRPLRDDLKVALRRARLLPLAFRMYEHVQAIAGRWQRQPAAVDGVPVPPAALRTRVAGTADLDWFLSSGREHAATIRSTMLSIGAPLEGATAILDFGCGCGRVVRQWGGIAPRVHGTDHDRPAIAWCRENLHFASFGVNDLEPPLAYADDVFDFAYAISVFTHTPKRLQRPWLEELVRVVRPGGHVLLTTHGDWCAERKLLEDERERFHGGALVVRDEAAGGSNLCAAFHPASYVREHLGDRLLERAFRPGSGVGFDQDLWVFEKPLPKPDARPG